MKRVWYERHGKGKKNDSSYEKTNSNKIYHEILKNKYVGNLKYKLSKQSRLSPVVEM